jgi:hypothetical protein
MVNLTTVKQNGLKFKILIIIIIMKESIFYTYYFTLKMVHQFFKLVLL